MINKKKIEDEQINKVLRGIIKKTQKDVDLQLNDALTLGQGFAKQTAFPLKRDYIKSNDVFKTEDTEV